MDTPLGDFVIRPPLDCNKRNCLLESLVVSSYVIELYLLLYSYLVLGGTRFNTYSASAMICNNRGLVIQYPLAFIFLEQLRWEGFLHYLLWR